MGMVDKQLIYIVVCVVIGFIIGYALATHQTPEQVTVEKKVCTADMINDVAPKVYNNAACSWWCKGEALPWLIETKPPSTSTQWLEMCAHNCKRIDNITSGVCQ